MLTYEIPGRGSIRVENIVLDYNGTMAIDGTPVPGCLERLRSLSEHVSIHVLTADTFGKAAVHLSDPAFDLTILPPGRQDEAKSVFVENLGASTTAAVGNGANDALMLAAAVLGLAVIQDEGAAAVTLQNADVVFTSINDALDVLLYPKRLVASLRT